MANRVEAPLLTVTDVELYERSVDLRLPFRFGAATITRAHQAVAHVRVRLQDGREVWGVAAESLAAKWFDKDPALTEEDNLDQLRQAIFIAADLYRNADGPRTAFGLFAQSYPSQMEQGAALDLNPLTASFGPALLDRAVADALGRVHDMPYGEMVARNLLGIVATDLTPDLRGYNVDDFLGRMHQRDSIAIRHTVGLLDPLTDADRQPGERVGDGLPETLEEVVRDYGCRYYKLKLSGNAEADLDRLARIASILDQHAPDYHATLDGNEQFADVDGIVELWRRIELDPRLGRLAKAVLYIEQPIRRDAALERTVEPLAAARPVMVDESDGTMDAFLQAWDLGYDGVSSKACKGFYKSILNGARASRLKAAGSRRAFLSAEDLTTWAGVSVQQDFAIVSALGLGHVERNGHHFIDGMRFASEREQESFLQAHPDLYHRQNGVVRMRIEDGEVSLRSLHCPGFAVGGSTDWAALSEMTAPPRGSVRQRAAEAKRA